MSMVQKRNMSLDNASQPFRPRHDELVPSRYALKVGEIDVLVISDGVLLLPGAMLAHNAEPAVRAAWLKDNFLPPDAFDWALNVVVVRSGGRTILIDAGMGTEFPDLPRSGQLIHRLDAAGIDLASVTDVVLTLSLPKTTSERIDGVVRQGSDTQRCSRSARSVVYKARPCQAKRESARHYNRSRISQEFNSRRIEPIKRST